MTTVGSSEDICPEYMEIPISVEVPRDEVQAPMVQASMSSDLQASMSLDWEGEDVPRDDDLTQICLKLLQPYQPPQICSELQPPSNNAAEDDWLVSILNYVDDTTDKPQMQGIPPLLRDKQSNKNCYDPLLVSIGPYHHKNPRLEAFEKLKIPIAQKFVHACGDQVSIKQLREEVEKVGERVRKWYKECFRDQVSIKHLREEVEKVGESVRKWYKECSTEQSQKFVRACGDQVSIKQLSEEVEEMGESVRKWYEECSPEQCDKFNKMMFLDACFVLYFIIYLYPKPEDTDKQEKEADPLDPLHRWRHYLVFVQRDLFLLENQIPLLLLEVLMKFLFKGERLDWEMKLIENFVDKKFIMPPQENPGNNDVKKFLAQMMGCIVQIKEKWKSDMDARHPDREPLTRSSPEDKNQKEKLKRSPHLLHLVREKLIGSCKNEKKSVKWHSYRSVTELKSAGIHFRPSQTNRVTDVEFKSHFFSGTLTLPPIVVDDTTKPLLLNLVAYEMCPDGPSDYLIVSYICLMDSLIDHAGDAKELRRRKILVNNLGSDEELAQLFNEIANGLVFDPSAYADVKLKIKNHCESRAKVWMAEWIHNHFSSPWAFLAFLGAILVIVLTVVQTYFAVFPH